MRKEWQKGSLRIGRRRKPERTDVDMRVTELCVLGTKRKALRKAAKKKLIDSLWLAAAATTTLAVIKQEQRRRVLPLVGVGVKSCPNPSQWTKEDEQA